jgi:zinc/manganese transport system ATP-binding protein
MTPPTIAIGDVTLSYDRQVALSGLSGSFAPGSLTAIAGPNGAGKTTLLRALAGLHAPDTGHITGTAGQIALLPQASQLDRSFPISCRDMVALGHWPRLGAFRGQTPAMRGAVSEALEAVGLTELASRPVGSLSSGQFQRALFARLIVQDAPILLLDEPFTAVDERTGADLLNLLLGWNKAGRTVIAVLHDLQLIQRAFPQTLLLAGVPVAWGATAAVLTPANLHRAKLGGWIEPCGETRQRPAA